MFRGFAADDDLSAFTLGVIDVFEDLLDSSRIYERALSGRRIKPKPELELGDSLFEKLGELVVNFFMDIKSVGTIVRSAAEEKIPNTSLA